MFGKQRTGIVACILLMFFCFQWQMSVNAQEVKNKVITAENVKQLRVIKRKTIGNDAIMLLSAATKTNLVAMVIEAYEASGLTHNIYLFDLDTYEVVNQFDRNDLGSVNLYSIKLNRDGTYLAMTVSGASASMWNAKKGTKLYDIQTDPHVDLFGEFDFSTDGKFFAATNYETDSQGYRDSVIELHDVKTGKLQSALTGDPESFDSYEKVAISPDLKYVAATTNTSKSPVIDVWELKTGRRIQSFKGHSNEILKVLFSPDSKSVISAGAFSDGSIRIWDIASGRSSAVLETKPPNADIAVNPQGTVLASIAEDGVIRLWDLATNAELIKLRDLTLTTELDTASLMNIAFSADGTKIIVGEITGKVQIWGIEP